MPPLLCPHLALTVPRLQLGSADGTMEELIQQLTASLDAVVVHKIGFTVTLYRDSSLPIPPAFSLATNSSSASTAGLDTEEEAAAGLLPEAWGSDAEESWDSEDEEVELLVEGEGEGAGAGMAEQQQQQPGGAQLSGRRMNTPKPPEFTIIG